MKKNFIPAANDAIASAFAQQTDSTPKSNYLQKGKHQKNAAWIMLWGGFALQ